MEIWKDVPNYKGLYQVSNLGNVKSFNQTKKGKIMRPCINRHGYRYIRLSNNYNQKTYELHQLLAITFLNHKPNGMTLVVDHIDHDRLNNNITNLQIITHGQNISKGKNK